MEPTEEEYRLITKFRSRVKDILRTPESQTPEYLIRWIRAREGNLEKAESMLRASLEWRQKHEADNILLRQFSPFLIQNYPFYADGVDRGGRPVISYQFGQWDIRRGVEEGYGDEILLYIIRLFETAVLRLREVNKNSPNHRWPLTQVVAVVDCGGYSYSQLTSVKSCEKIIQSLLTMESHYPEILFRGIFFNAPLVFNILYKMVRPLMPKKTILKIRIIGSNSEEWKKVVYEHVDPCQLRPAFGGTKVDTNT